MKKNIYLNWQKTKLAKFSIKKTYCKKNIQKKKKKIAPQHFCVAEDVCMYGLASQRLCCRPGRLPWNHPWRLFSCFGLFRFSWYFFFKIVARVREAAKKFFLERGGVKGKKLFIGSRWKFNIFCLKRHIQILIFVY